MSMPVAAVQSLVEFIHRSQASTTSEFVVMAQDIAQVLKSSARNPVPLECHQNLINLGTKFVEKAASCRESIAELGKPFIRDDSVSNPIILSRVYMTEARPINSDYRTAVHLSHADIPCTVVLNFTVGYIIFPPLQKPPANPSTLWRKATNLCPLFPLNQFDLPMHTAQILPFDSPQSVASPSPSLSDANSM
ncbi:translation initiation factor eIF-2B subunit alpha [Dimargaris cristalligena]|nr:translation initiation factor eIF-2B subunit alpha [Dimargaris cristalligena]